MNILILSEFFPSKKGLKFSGGVEARNYFVAKNLSKKNNVYIICRNTDFNKTTTEIISKINVVRVGSRQKYNATTGNIMQRLSFVTKALKESKKLDIEIVEGTNYLTHFIAKLISIRKKIPVVAWYPDVWTGKWIKNAGISGIIGEVLERINLFLDFDYYIAISKSTADKLKKHGKKKMKVITCGIDPKEFSGQLTSPKKNIICVSRLTSYKKIKNLILAFALLQKEKKDFKLIIVGRGPECKSLLKLIDELNLRKNIKIISNLNRNDLIRKYKSSYLFTLPSEVEGFGISVIEAAAAGVPYVINDIPVFREITDNSKGGIITDTNNLYVYSNTLKDLIENKKLYEKKKKELKLIVIKHNWINISKTTEKLYMSLT